MPTVICPGCQKVIRIREDLLGHKFLCEGCGYHFTAAHIAEPSVAAGLTPAVVVDDSGPAGRPTQDGGVAAAFLRSQKKPAWRVFWVVVVGFVVIASVLQWAANVNQLTEKMKQDEERRAKELRDIRDKMPPP
jgi:hypothetical protein